MRFPDGRRMTAAERRGFDLACETLAAWGTQIARAGQMVQREGRDGPGVPLSRLMEHNGKIVAELAHAAQAQADWDAANIAGAPRQVARARRPLH